MNNKKWKKQFLIIYSGQAFSLLGSAAVQFSVIWWLTVQTESAITLTISSIVAFLPTLLIGPFAGVWIDRYSRKTVMIVADGMIALSSAVLGIVFIFVQTPPVWFVYLILFLRGLGNAFHGPALQAAIPMLVPAEMLTKAGGWGNLVESSSAMLGPVLGAALMAFSSISSIMLVDIVGAAFAIVCLLFINIPKIEQDKENTRFFSDMKQGFYTLRKNKPLMAVFFPLVLVRVIFMPLGTLFPLLVRTHYMGDAWHNGVVEFIFAAGLLVSSLLVALKGGMKKRFLMVTFAIVLLGITSLISGALPGSGFWIFAVCCFFMGAAGTFISVPLMAYVQETIAPDMMGKVFSLIMASISLATPVGLLVAGPVSEVVGIDQWFLWSGAALIGTGILCRILTKPYDKETMMIGFKEKE